jgi:hypothetical protein
VKDVGVGKAVVHDGRITEVVTGSLRLGQLDSNSAIFTQQDASGTKLITNFTLILTDKEGQPLSDEATQQEGPAEWRISGNHRRPQISVATAIRYITEIREHASSAVIKRNADRTLLKLKALQ